MEHIGEQVREHHLNRVVVASCTPLTHEPLFRDSLRQAGLNPYLFEMANIRNQCSWVHSQDRPGATAKAKRLVGMATARASLLEPQTMVQVPVQQRALVVGGGPAGLTAAASLAEQGFPVDLVEREASLGGNLRRIRIPRDGIEPSAILERLIQGVVRQPEITIHLETEVTATSGFMGNFTSTLRGADGSTIEVQHGVTILATGGSEYQGDDFGFGTDERIISQSGFEAILAGASPRPNSVAMIQCVGPAADYCSRICCTTALKNALALKGRNPDAQVVIFHRDIRAYGFKERLYEQARRAGVIFVRYDEQQPPRVSHQPALTVTCIDSSLAQKVAVSPDLLVLSMPIVPQPDAREVAARFKVPLDRDGFFLEAHVKLRPVDFASDGIFMAGMAHYPKLVDEAMIQAKAAAARAARVLSQDSLSAGGRVAVVDPSRCTGCLTCVRICPFEVPKVSREPTGIGGIMGAAFIEAAVCQGCGSCVAECPAQAIELRHYTDAQLQAKALALMVETPSAAA